MSSLTKLDLFIKFTASSLADDFYLKNYDESKSWMDFWLRNIPLQGTTFERDTVNPYLLVGIGNDSFNAALVAILDRCIQGSIYESETSGLTENFTVRWNAVSTAVYGVTNVSMMDLLSTNKYFDNPANLPTDRATQTAFLKKFQTFHSSSVALGMWMPVVPCLVLLAAIPQGHMWYTAAQSMIAKPPSELTGVKVTAQLKAAGTASLQSSLQTEAVYNVQEPMPADRMNLMWEAYLARAPKSDYLCWACGKPGCTRATKYSSGCIPRDTVCEKCNNTGHVGKVCGKWKRNNNGSSLNYVRPETVSPSSFVALSSPTTSDFNPNVAIITPDPPQAKAMATLPTDYSLSTIKPESVIVDSGASMGIAKETELHAFDTDKTIRFQTAGGPEFSTGAGIQKIQLQTTDNKPWILEYPAHALTGCPSRLASLGHLISLGYTVAPDLSMLITPCTKHWIPMVMENGVPTLCARIILPDSTPGRYVTFSVTDDLSAEHQSFTITAEEAHRRFFHVNNNRLRQAAKQCKGVPKVSNISKRSSCIGCAEGKLHRKPTTKGPHAPHATSAKQVFSVDFTGDKVKSVQGNKFGLIFLDLVSKSVHVEYTATKQGHDVARALRRFRAEKFGNKQCEGVQLQVDCDSSFLKGHFKAQADLYNWPLNKRSPGDHATHYVERAVQSLGEMTATQLHSSGLGPSYWQDSMEHAVYGHNRLPSTEGRQPPLTAETGRAADLSSVVEFGSLVLFHKSVGHISKRDYASRGSLGISLGLEHNATFGLHRILNLSTKQIVLRRSVRSFPAIMPTPLDNPKQVMAQLRQLQRANAWPVDCFDIPPEPADTSNPVDPSADSSSLQGASPKPRFSGGGPAFAAPEPLGIDVLEEDPDATEYSDSSTSSSSGGESDLDNADSDGTPLPAEFTETVPEFPEPDNGAQEPPLPEPGQVDPERGLYGKYWNQGPNSSTERCEIDESHIVTKGTRSGKRFDLPSSHFVQGEAGIVLYNRSMGSTMEDSFPPKSGAHFSKPELFAESGLHGGGCLTNGLFVKKVKYTQPTRKTVRFLSTDGDRLGVKETALSLKENIILPEAVDILHRRKNQLDKQLYALSCANDEATHDYVYDTDNANPVAIPLNERDLRRLTPRERMLWEEAMATELKGIHAHGVLQRMPDKKVLSKPIGTRWVFTRKAPDSKGRVRLKARLVVLGYQQPEDGINWAAPTAATSHIKAQLIKALTLNQEVWQVDIGQAFLRAPIEDENIYVTILGEVYLLKAGLYGLVSSPARWYRHIREILVEHGFIASRWSPCVFEKGDMTLTCHVDDMMITGQRTEVETLLGYLRKEFGNDGVVANRLDNQQGKSRHLGLGVTFDKKAKTCKLDQQEYLQELLELVKMEKCKSVSTPAVPHVFLHKHDKEENDSRYRVLVGKLIWLLMTRIDIAFAVKELGRHGIRNGPEHWDAVMQVIRYLRGTASQGLLLRGVDDPTGLILTGYVDSSYAECKDSRKSTSGFGLTLGPTVIRHSSFTQKTVAVSSCEAELYGLFEIVHEVVAMRRTLSDMGMEQMGPTAIYLDSQSAINLMGKLAPTGRSKHIDVRFFKVKELIEKNVIALHFEPTESLVVDSLTKPLGPKQHRRLTHRMLNGEVYPTGTPINIVYPTGTPINILNVNQDVDNNDGVFFFASKQPCNF